MALLFEIATVEWDRCIQIFLRLCFIKAQPELKSISKGPEDFFHEDGHQFRISDLLAQVW